MRISRVLVAAVTAAFLLSSCFGAKTPPVVSQPALTANPGAVAVFVQFSEIGKDVEVTGRVVGPLVEKALQAANVKITPVESKAGLMIHGTVKLQIQETTRRLGLDKHRYAAHAFWQILRPSGLLILKRETVSEGAGTGKMQAITNTLTSLAGKITAEALPHLKQMLASR
jgi:hypothetical protein